MVVLPASGCEIIAKVRLIATAAAIGSLLISINLHGCAAAESAADRRPLSVGVRWLERRGIVRENRRRFSSSTAARIRHSDRRARLRAIRRFAKVAARVNQPERRAFN